ncbi:MAG TPA: hypothetical protein PK762_01170 [Candidatus Kapabacteria bacterium]|nr:hypothetical protein [Candidatus Kapabacteria bacterium]
MKGLLKKSYLLVEGNDDFHVIKAIATKFKINNYFVIIDCNGIDNIKKGINDYQEKYQFDILGIVLDADFDFSSRWESIKNYLKKFGYSTPKEFPKEGLILSNEENKKVGVWIMPNNSLEGKVEDFVKYLIPAQDELLPIVESHLSEIEEKILNPYEEKDRPKALIHSWLAIQKTPGSPMGAAITKQYFSTNNEICTQFVNWLKRLFVEEI